MNIIFDVVMLAILIITVVVHIRKGFIESLLHTFSTVIAAVCAVLLGPRVGELLKIHVFGDRLTEKIYEMVEPMCSFVEEKVNVGDVLAEKLSGDFGGLLSRLGVSIDELIRSFGSIELWTAEDTRRLAQSIAEPVADSISKVLGCVLVFFGMLLVLLILRLVMKLFVQIPVVKQTNQVLGAVLGIICGLIYVWAICMVLGGVLEYGLISDAEGVLGGMLNGSIVYNFFLKLTLH